MFMWKVFLSVLLVGSVHGSAAQQPLSALRSGKVASWLQKAWQQPKLQKLSATLLVGGMLTLPVQAVQEQVAPLVQSSTVDEWDADRSLLQELRFVPVADERWQAAMNKLRLGNIDINATDGGGNTILMLAAGCDGCTKIIEVLVLYGAAVNLANDGGYTALMEASKYTNEENVTALLRSGANINAVNLRGDTALMVSLRSEAYYSYRKYKIEEKLLEHDGIAVNITNHDGNTALMLAVLRGDLKLVTSLLEKGARVDIVNKHGESALTLALKLKHAKIRELLDKRGDIQAEVVDSWEASGQPHTDDEAYPAVQSRLDKEATQHKLAIVSSILDWTYGGDATAAVGKALRTAAVHGDLNTVKALLLHTSVDVDAAARDNSTALTLAASRGRLKIVTLLLQAGAYVDTVNSYGQQTPLMFAVQGGHYQTVRLLLKSGARVNAEDEEGGTALSYAVMGQHNDYGTVKLIKLLLDNGAAPNIAAGEKQYTPLMHTALSEDTDSTRLLLQYGAEFTDEQRKNVSLDQAARIMKTIHEAWAL